MTPLKNTDTINFFTVTDNIYKGIYSIECNKEPFIYIGRSKNCLRRFNEHKSKYKKTNTFLYKKIREIGIENFDFTILELIQDDKKLAEREIEWIAHLKPNLNSNKGGKGNSRNISHKERKKLSIANKKHWENLSKEKKEEIIKNQLTGRKKGYKHLDSTKDKLRKINTGKKQSKETIAKRVLKLKGKKRKNDYLFVKVASVKNNEIIKTFDSVKDAAEFYNCCASNISKVLSGKQKTSKGYKFIKL